MNGFKSVMKRELIGYFATPVAYVFLVIFLFGAGFLPFRDKFYEFGQADLRMFFGWIPILYIFMVPSTAMRMWSEERKSGSIELLFTLPITVTQAVLGKFTAAWIFMGIALALTAPFPITVCYLGNPDIGQIITGYIGAFLMAGGYLAIGCFFSALTKNQVISFILAVVACAILYYIGRPTSVNFMSYFLPTNLTTMISNLSFQNHFESMQRGVVKAGDLIFFVLMIAGWIWACCVVLIERKAA